MFLGASQFKGMECVMKEKVRRSLTGRALECLFHGDADDTHLI
jgi:hypothetical protein